MTLVVTEILPEAVVLGALFAVPRNQKCHLDRAEGLGHGYEEKHVTVRIGEGQRIALTYVAETSHVDNALRPYSWYRDLVVFGARGLGMLESLSKVSNRSKPRLTQNRNVSSGSGPSCRATTE